MKILKYFAITLILMTILYIPFFPLNYGSYFPACLGVFLLLFIYFKNKNKIIYKIMSVVLCYFVITFSVYSAFSVKTLFNDNNRNYDAVVVLGAGLNKDGSISNTLKHRLDKCLSIDTTGKKIVVSGGQGSDEPISEAFAMSEYLIANGIPKDRILLEDKSTNTKENFLFTKEILDSEFEDDYSIAYITNDFHSHRSALYMRDAGLEGFAISSTTPLYMIPSCYLRDYVALQKYYILD